MIDLTGVTHHPALEQIVEVLCNKTQNTDRGFFRAEVAYFLAKMASNMRAIIITKDRGEIPVNIYALGLATSGFGKGHSVHIVENDFLKGFKERFTKDTLPVIADQHLWKLATERALRNNTDPQDEYNDASAEYKRAGAFPFTFDSGTVPAVKQLRQKLLLANAGSISLQIDEIGSNLEGNTEMLTVYLELYDQGIVKNKLTKNTADSIRGEELDGKTPCNLLMFGTPSKLLDGGPTEEHFYSFLDTGYARRCLFGMGHQERKAFHSQTPAEIYARLIQPTNNATVTHWANHFHTLADAAKYGWRMVLEDDVAIELLSYKIECEKAAELMADHEEMRKAEMSHRYFKALKLAGAYAFVDGSNEVEMEHLKQAILLVEESGTAFQTILNREKTYVKLAKYIASVDTEVTHADLLEALPYYPRSNSHRNEMITLATAWGHTRHISIKKTFYDGIEFFRGETLELTNLDEMVISYGDHWAYNYLAEKVPFDQLHVVAQAPGVHWANHHFKGGHRAEENVHTGFNMIVIDVDEGITLATCHELMKEFKFFTYTTKRHQVGEHGDRFRLVLPMNYVLNLDSDEYKEFMNNVMGWLPFKTDESANQRAKKWEANEAGVVHYNLDGELFDVLPFIPKTSKNEQYKKGFQALESLDNLERWFAGRIASGNRNKQMIKYALALVDGGMGLLEVTQQVHAFNGKLNAPLSKQELETTILSTVAKRFERMPA